MPNPRKATDEQINELECYDGIHEIDYENITHTQAKSLIKKLKREERTDNIDGLLDEVLASRHAKKLTKKPTKTELGKLVDAYEARGVYYFGQNEKFLKQVIQDLIKNFPWLGNSKPRPTAKKTKAKKGKSSCGCILIVIICVIIYIALQY